MSRVRAHEHCRIIDPKANSWPHSYRELTKPDLVSALDQHLLDNQAAFENDKTFAEYYKRLPSSSPVKNESSIEVATTARTPGRKPRVPRETT